MDHRREHGRPCLPARVVPAREKILKKEEAKERERLSKEEQEQELEEARCAEAESKCGLELEEASTGHGSIRLLPAQGHDAGGLHHMAMGKGWAMLTALVCTREITKYVHLCVWAQHVDVLRGLHVCPVFARATSAAEGW